jgi:deoxycytidine triphosphate deaminase
MILAASELKRRIRDGSRARIGDEKQGTYPLVEDIYRDFEIEGSSIDFSIESLYEIKTSLDVNLFIDKRNTGRVVEVKTTRIDEEKRNVFYLIPSVPYIGQTREIVNMPLDLIAFPIQRVTCFTAGLSIETGVIQPNFFGKLKFGIYNRNSHVVTVEQGFRIITVVFQTLLGETNIYNGYHQGGDNISTNGEFAPPR